MDNESEKMTLSTSSLPPTSLNPNNPSVERTNRMLVSSYNWTTNGMLLVEKKKKNYWARKIWVLEDIFASARITKIWHYGDSGNPPARKWINWQLYQSISTKQMNKWRLTYHFGCCNIQAGIAIHITTEYLGDQELCFLAGTDPLSCRRWQNWEESIKTVRDGTSRRLVCRRRQKKENSKGIWRFHSWAR